MGIGAATADAPAAPDGPALSPAAAWPARLNLPALPSQGRLAAFAAVCAVLLLAGFITLRLQLNGASKAVAAQYAALRLEAATPAGAESTTGPANPIAAALQVALAPYIAKGMVAVTERPGQTVVTLRGDALFEPGSATLTANAGLVLAQQAAALGREGAAGAAVQVIGHTDNQPVRSVRYPSNFQLSLERAQAVRDRLATSMDRSRLSAEGRADSEPVASNDTPEGRAANRRIEIVIRQPASAAPQAAAQATPEPAGTYGTGSGPGPVQPPAAAAPKVVAPGKSKS